jgi:beta-hydroxyacyl-ACP dehydratase FabZ
MTAGNLPPYDMLPHSYPFVLLDRIIEFSQGAQIVCLKNVTVNEEFFSGHFRGNPVMPGVLLIEAMAQASGLIIGKEKEGAYLAGVKDARFKRPVVPGDRLIIKSSLIQKFYPMYVFEAEALVDDKVVADAEITLAVLAVD